MSVKKGIICLTVVLTLILAGGANSFAADSAIQVVVNGDKLELATQPYVENSQTLVPLRSIFEALEANVQYDSDTGIIVATKDDSNISLQVGKSTAQVNGQAVKLSLAAKSINSQTFVPLRFVSEALGADVYYEAKTKTIYIGQDFYGNDPSNLANWGEVLQDGEITYIAQNNGLMRYDTNSKEKTVLLSENVYGLNKVGDYLYFNNFGFIDESGIYRYNIKTEKLELLQDGSQNDSGYESLTIYNNWVYFIGKGSAICQMRLDGTSCSVLNTMGASSLFIYEDTIYFGNGGDDCKLYRMDLNGKNVKKVCDISTGYSVMGIGYAGWIYFTTETNYVTSIYRMRSDGSNLENVVEGIDSEFALYEGKIYYSKGESEYYDNPSYNSYTGSLYSFDLSQNKTEKLFPLDEDAWYISFVGADGFYYEIIKVEWSEDYSSATFKYYLYYYDFSKGISELIENYEETI